MEDDFGSVTEGSALAPREVDTGLGVVDYSRPLELFSDDHFKSKPVEHCVHTCCEFTRFTLLPLVHYVSCSKLCH